MRRAAVIGVAALWLLLSACALLIAGQVARIQKASYVSVGGVSFSDDFNRANNDSLGANWTEANGDPDIDSNQLLGSSGGFTENLAIHNTALNTTSGYIRAVRSDDASFHQLLFRYTNASSPYYKIDIANSSIGWSHVASIGGSATEIVSASITTGAGTVIAMTFTGTGTNTIIRIWIDPTGNTPDSLISWGGDTTPDFAWTNDPASPVDSGALVGIGGNAGAANTNRWDDFFAGDTQ